MRGNDAAAVRSEKTGLEIERPEEMTSRVGERDGGGPSDKFGRIRSASRGDELDGAEFHYAVKRADRVVVPLGPPTTQRMAHVFIGRMLHEEVDVVDAGSMGIDAVRVGGGENVVDTNKVPARASGTGRKIRNKEKFVGTGSKGGGESCRPRGWGWGAIWMSNWNGKGVHGSERWKGARVNGIKECSGLDGARRVTGSSGRRWVGEPYFIVLLDLQVALQGIGERGVTVVEVSEVGAVNRGAGKNAGGDG